MAENVKLKLTNKHFYNLSISFTPLIAAAIKGVKHNTKGSHDKFDCQVCLGPLETQEHLQKCPGAWFERRGLVLDREEDL